MSPALIEGLLECLEKTAGESINLYSKFVGGEAYPKFVKQIVAKIPEQTAEQLKDDAGLKRWSPEEQRVWPRIVALGEANARREILKRHESTKIDAIGELWFYEKKIGEWLREYQAVFRHRYNEQCFAMCLRKGWLRKEDLASLDPDRIKHIEKIAEKLSRAEAESKK